MYLCKKRAMRLIFKILLWNSVLPAFSRAHVATIFCVFELRLLLLYKKLLRNDDKSLQHTLIVLRNSVYSTCRQERWVVLRPRANYVKQQFPYTFSMLLNGLQILNIHPLGTPPYLLITYKLWKLKTNSSFQLLYFAIHLFFWILLNVSLINAV